MGKKSKESVEDVAMTPVEVADEEEKKDNEMVAPTAATLESFEKIKKKKMNKKAKEKKPLYRMDSDIAFNAPSLSQINLMELDESKPEEMTESKSSTDPSPIEQSATPVPAAKAP